jgi:hypothetical protein
LKGSGELVNVFSCVCLAQYRSHTDQGENPTSVESHIAKRSQSVVSEGEKQTNWCAKTEQKAILPLSPRYRI